MDASGYQKLKYYVRDKNRFQLYKHEWCVKNKRLYEDMIEKYKDYETRPYVIDLALDEVTYTVFDLETTGFFHDYGDEIISIGATKINLTHPQYSEKHYQIIRPIKEVPKKIQALIGLSEEEITREGIPFPTAFLNFIHFSQSTILVAFPATFDVVFLKELAKRWGFPPYRPFFLDAMKIAQALYPEEKNSLDKLIKTFDIPEIGRHHALKDAEMTAEVFVRLLGDLKEKGITSYKQLLNLRRNRSQYFIN